MSNSTKLPAKRVSLVEKFARRYSIEPEKLLDTLKATAFKQRDGVEITNEQMAALLIVADQYGLNPFTREIYAFADRQNGIVPIVGVDGWCRIINNDPNSDGIEFRQSENMITPPRGKPCPEWLECIIYRKDRQHPVVVREYLDEVYQPPKRTKAGGEFNGPWQTHTKRMLRHKALIQAARAAYGFVGIYDEDEAERIISSNEIIEAEVVDSEGDKQVKGVEGVKAILAAKKQKSRGKVEPEIKKDSPQQEIKTPQRELSELLVERFDSPGTAIKWLKETTNGEFNNIKGMPDDVALELIGKLAREKEDSEPKQDELII